MDIRCNGEQGDTIVTSRENLYFWATLISSLAPLTGMAVQLPVVAGGISILTVVGVSVSWFAVAAFAHYRLWREKARILRPNEAEAVFDIVGVEAARIGLKPRLLPRIYVSPWDTRVTARVLGGFASKIVVSGGFAVLAVRQKNIAEIILRHELAHIAAGDTKMFAYLVFLIAGVAYIPFSGADFGTGVFASILQACLLYYLLRRREYFADAFSLNWTSSASEYKSALLGATNERKTSLQPEQYKTTLFHPDNSARIKAIERDSPILRTSIPLVVFFLLVLIGGIKTVGTKLIHPMMSPIEGAGVLFSFLVATALPVVGIVSEVSKGFGRKHPLPFPEFVDARSEDSLKNQLLSRRYANRQQFANVIGVGSNNVEWSRVTLYLFALCISHVIFKLRDPEVLASRLLVSEAMWGVCMLVAFRYRSTVFGVALFAATINALAWFMIDALGSGFPFGILRAFPYLLLGALSFTAGVRFIKPLWLGVLAGMLGDSVIVNFAYRISNHTPSSIIWRNVPTDTLGSLLFTVIIVAGLTVLSSRQNSAAQTDAIVKQG
jgi:Zn-dependent protease with chaperone function